MWIMAVRVVTSRSPSCRDPADPGRTPPLITLWSSTPHSPSSPPSCGPVTRLGGSRCWCAPTPPAPPKAFAAHLDQRGVDFSVGARFAHLDVTTALAAIPKQARTPAYQARRPRAAETGVQIQPRDGAWVAEATGLVPLTGWSTGTRLILRKERPHPGAQLRITDRDGLRITGFLTNTTHGGPGTQLADLELRHRRHARVEDASARRRTPGCATYPSTTPTRTASGSPSTPSPKTCSPDAPAPPYPRSPLATKPNGCAYASSPPPDGSSAPRGATSCTSTRPGPGPPRSLPPTPDSARSSCPDPPQIRPTEDLEHRQMTLSRGPRTPIAASSGTEDQQPLTKITLRRYED